ncbi:DDE-type integrase/transposase/recombinase [Saccharothrix espanaensis]|uniref:DDE-type integrase/transposase/recombinase n=1 Tax=Saccharothrix espanaensis TaxID=103731 RepID=UPI001E448D20|nr:DDE-type integrase/transposase/recombinase [Saccharothrix espanaensis]
MNRDFTAPAPDRLWVADATRIRTGEGVFWLAAVRDAFSNRIVGWKTSDRYDTGLVLGALEYAIWSRDVRDGQLIHHSDRGSTYTAFRLAERLADGILPSMGSVGDSYDNALMENFFSTLKIELVYRRSWRTRDEAENDLFAYIDGPCCPIFMRHEGGRAPPRRRFESARVVFRSTRRPAGSG